MADAACKRVSVDQRSTDRQNLVPAEAGASSRLHPLQRQKSDELLTYARPGATVHPSETFRLARGTQHIPAVPDVLHQGRPALRIHDGAFSARDLTARHPRAGELLSTGKFTVQTHAAAGEPPRDLQREPTHDGLRAAEAKSSRGRRPAVKDGKSDAVRAAYPGGRTVAGLAREHGVSRGTGAGSVRGRRP